jgi:hypothetical protein
MKRKRKKNEIHLLRLQKAKKGQELCERSKLGAFLLTELKTEKANNLV